MHPGVDRETIEESTGWEIRFSAECGETEASDELLSWKCCAT